MTLRKWFQLCLWSALFAAPLVFAQSSGNSETTIFTFWSLPRVWVGLLLALAGTLWLIVGTVRIWIRAVFMAIAFFAFSILSLLPLGSFAKGMGLHPSPMCMVEKPFLFLNAGRAVPLVFISLLVIVGIMTVVSNKSFCGWTCPIGAAQELLYMIPVPKRWKRNFSFKLANSIRIGMFVFFLGFLFTIGYSVYAYINPFEFLHWRFEWVVIPAFTVTFVAALFFWRPFCHLVCPLGLVTWFFEHISIVRIKLNNHTCTDCKLCVKKAPCTAVPAILEGKRIRPDCYACGECIRVCPDNALDFKA